VPIAYVDTDMAERVFRAKVLALLKEGGLLSEEREQILLSWRHRTGFSVHNQVTVEPEDGDAVERLARYLVRPPVSLQSTRSAHSPVPSAAPKWRSSASSSNPM